MTRCPEGRRLAPSESDLPPSSSTRSQYFLPIGRPPGSACPEKDRPIPPSRSAHGGGGVVGWWCGGVVVWWWWGGTHTSWQTETGPVSQSSSLPVSQSSSLPVFQSSSLPVSQQSVHRSSPSRSVAIRPSSHSSMDGHPQLYKYMYQRSRKSNQISK